MADQTSLKVLLIPMFNPKVCKLELGRLASKPTFVLFAKSPVSKIVFLFKTTGKLSSTFNSSTFVSPFDSSKSFAGVLIYVRLTISK